MSELLSQASDFISRVWVQRLLLFVGGILAGWILDRILGRWIKRLAERTSTDWDDVFAAALRGLPTAWLGAAGAYAALGVGQWSNFVLQTGLKAVTVVFIASTVLGVMRLAGGAVEKAASHPSGALPSSSLVVKLTQGLVGVLGLFIILQNLDIEIAPLLTALGVGGLAVALALQDTLSNLFAGVQIILTRQVRTGDYVRLASGEEGHVTDVKGRNTTIQTFPDGNLVVVPNSNLASSIVTNYSMPRKALWVTVPVGVAYDSDLSHVERVTVEVARGVLEELPGARAEDPVFRYSEFGDSSINFNVRMKVGGFTSQPAVRHEFIKRLHRRFDEEGIVIPFPIRTLNVPGGRAKVEVWEGSEADATADAADERSG